MTGPLVVEVSGISRLLPTGGMMLAQSAGMAVVIAIVSMHRFALAPFALELAALVLAMLALPTTAVFEVLASIDALAAFMTVAVVIVVLGESGGRAAKRKC